MLNSYKQFEFRLLEVECLIGLIPPKPSSATSKQFSSLCRASIILLCSHLEGFLQDLMEEVIEEVNQLSIGFKLLPLELYLQHTYPKGQLQHNNIDNLMRLLREIKLLENSNLCVKLNKKNFSKTEGNPTPDLINRLFSTFGEKDILDVLNLELLNLETKEVIAPFLREDEKQELIKTLGYPAIIDHIDGYLTKKRNGSGKKDRSIGFYNIINTLLNYRNNIAHGNVGICISNIELVELKDNIVILVKALADKAEKRINILKGVDESLNNAAATYSSNNSLCP